MDKWIDLYTKLLGTQYIVTDADHGPRMKMLAIESFGRDIIALNDDQDLADWVEEYDALLLSGGDVLSNSLVFSNYIAELKVIRVEIAQLARSEAS